MSARGAPCSNPWAMDVVSKTSAVEGKAVIIFLLTMAHHSLGPVDVYASVLNAGEFPALTWRFSVYQVKKELVSSSAPLFSL